MAAFWCRKPAGKFLKRPRTVLKRLTLRICRRTATLGVPSCTPPNPCFLAGSLVFTRKKPHKRGHAVGYGKQPGRVTTLHPALPLHSGLLSGGQGCPNLPQGSLGLWREGGNGYFPPSRQSPRDPLREVRAPRGPKARGGPDLPKGVPRAAGGRDVTL